MLMNEVFFTLCKIGFRTLELGKLAEKFLPLSFIVTAELFVQ